ncbi:hypothetical protein ACS0TY_019336 [Phlomoides rotata]
MPLLSVPICTSDGGVINFWKDWSCSFFTRFQPLAAFVVASPVVAAWLVSQRPSSQRPCRRPAPAVAPPLPPSSQPIRTLSSSHRGL